MIGQRTKFPDSGLICASCAGGFTSDKERAEGLPSLRISGICRTENSCIFCFAGIKCVWRGVYG